MVFGSGDRNEEALKDHDRNLREVLTRYQQKTSSELLMRCSSDSSKSPAWASS